VLITAALINGLLDPVLIFGLFGFPALGVQGAAMATVVSNTIVLVFTVWRLQFVIRVYASPLAPLGTILESWKHVLHIGIPAMITNSIIPVSSAIVVSMIATFGVEAVAGFGVAMRIEPIFLIPFYALSAISSPFFGQNSGAGRFDRLFEARRVLTRFCLWFGLALAVVLVIVSKPLTGLYSTAEPIQSVAISYLWIATWSYGAYGLVMSVNAAFNGMGKPLPGVAISTCRVIVVFLPLAFALREFMGLTGLFAATLVSNLLMGGVAWAWLGRQVNSLRSTAPAPSDES
jgi:Na+-driven multidrug efflux pump